MDYEILPYDSSIDDFLKTRRLDGQFNKQLRLLRTNPRAKSLNFELLEPKKNNMYSFRVNDQWRALCFFINNGIKIFKITDYH